MLRRPAFRPHWHVAPVGNAEVFLLAEGRNVVLSGRAYVELARLIDGERTTDAIVDELMGVISATEIYLGLLRLERDGFIEDRDAQVLPTPEAAWWGMHGVSQTAALAALRSSKIGVRGVGCVDDGPVRRMLHESGAIVASRDDPDPSLHIVVVDDYLQPELRSIDADLRAMATPWLLVKPVGIFPWFGPLFQHGAGPCWTCLAQRLTVNRDTEEYVRQAINAPRPFSSLAASAGSAMSTIGMAVTEVTRFVVSQTTSLTDTVISINAATFDVDRHRVVRRPQCPVCGDPEMTRKARPVEPQARTRSGGSGCRSS